jgi:hypothetical protein
MQLAETRVDPPSWVHASSLELSPETVHDTTAKLSLSFSEPLVQE